MNIALWAVQVLLALAFAGAGFMKVSTPIPDLLAQGMTFVAHVPAWLVRFIGAAELAGAAGLVLPWALRIQPWLTPLAAAALVVVMVLAAGAHVLEGELAGLAAPIVLGGLSALVAWGRGRKAGPSAR